VNDVAVADSALAREDGRMLLRRAAAVSVLAAVLALAGCGDGGRATGQRAGSRAASPTGPEGKVAPGFSVTAFTAGGETLDLAALRAKGPVVVNFFESWCSTCNHEQPDLDAAAAAYAGRVSFVGLNNRDTVEDGRGYATSHGVPYPLAHAPEVWAAYGVPHQPVTVVIAADGRELKRWAGAVTQEQLAEVLDGALAA
jgi:thioredoxin-like negative regulator of GroEL